MDRTRRRMLAGTAGLLTASTVAGCLDDDGNNTGDENGDENGTAEQEETNSVTFLVERVGGTHEEDEEHDHEGDEDEEDEDEEHDHEGDEDEEDEEHDHEGDEDEEDNHEEDEDEEHDHEDDETPVSQAAIDEACSHLEFDDPESVDAGSTSDEAPSVSGTHQPFETSFNGDAGYVVFEAQDGDDSHDHEEEEEEHDHEEEGDDAGDEESALAIFVRDGSAHAVEGTVEHEESNVDGCDRIDSYLVIAPDNGRAVIELNA